MPLNDQQRAAAQAAHDTALKIIAGAGTGKTETLAARFVELVRHGIAPERIVLLTFTEDAAAEMRARVMLRLRESEIDLPPDALLDPWIATFHGFAMRLLHEFGFEIGLPPTPRLLTDDDQQEVWQAVRESIETDEPLPDGYTPLDHVAYRWDNDETWNKVLGVIDALRRGGGTPAELAPDATLHAQQTTTFAAQRAQLVPLIEHCFNAYTTHLSRSGALDFDEQLQAALRLLRRSPRIGERFDVVMVDEFQDTNRPQLALLTALQPDFSRTTVVGDPRQAIYGWNSARAESIYRFPFRENGEGHEQPLTENYRSHPLIVEAANLALRDSYLGKQPDLRASGERTAERHPALGETVVSLHALPTIADESRLVAAELRRLHESGIPHRDMAVLIRSRTHLNVLRESLAATNVPYVVNGGTGFYLQGVVRLTASLLRLLADPAPPYGSAAAWAHLLESPLIGLTPDIIAVTGPPFDPTTQRPTRLFTQWLSEPESVPMWLPRRVEAVQRIAAFQRFFAAARQRWSILHPTAYLEWLWRESGLVQTLLSRQDEQALLTLRQLAREADEYAAAHTGEGIAGFAALLVQRVGTQPRVPPPTVSSADAVEVATVHQAKGREWPVVFVINTGLPSKRAGQVDSVLWDEQWKLVISDNNPPRGRAPDPLQQLRADLRSRQRNEERSIWYVALTRARERLYIVHSGCTLSDEHFTDAREKIERVAQGQAPDPVDEAVHFFHELWERVQEQTPPDGCIMCSTATISGTEHESA